MGHTKFCWTRPMQSENPFLADIAKLMNITEADAVRLLASARQKRRLAGAVT